MSVPNSKIYFCSDVYLNPSYNNTIFFESAEAQRTYFSGKVVNTFSDYTYLRKNKSIKIQCAMDTANTFSYLFFDNHSSGYTKTYYYFVTDVQYINDTTSEIFIELDVMQTYAFNYWLRPCFVEREHSATDTVGENVLDEGLDLGQIVVNSKTEMTDIDDLCVLILSNVNLIEATETLRTSEWGGLIGGVYSGADLYAVGSEDWLDLSQKLAEFDQWGYSEGILAMWMYPKALVKLANDQEWGADDPIKSVSGVGRVETETVSKSFSDLDGYTPKNNKLFTYPYNFLYVSNNLGGACAYHFERFYNEGSATINNANFRIYGSMSPDGVAKLVPMYYDGVEENFEEGLTLSGFPTCAWNQDVYKLWLAQNQNSHTLKIATGVLSIVGGGVALATGVGTSVGVTGITAGVGMIASHLAAKQDKAIQPEQAKGNFSGSLNISAGVQHFTAYRKSVNAETARIIDNYFSMFGYKTNRVKIPNRDVRENWTYTKTVDCTVYGNLPKADIQKIESVFNHGITFWKNGDQIGNYNLSNNCL